jgi:hypothetical protein
VGAVSRLGLPHLIFVQQKVLPQNRRSVLAQSCAHGLARSAHVLQRAFEPRGLRQHRDGSSAPLRILQRLGGRINARRNVALAGRRPLDLGHDRRGLAPLQPRDEINGGWRPSQLLRELLERTLSPGRSHVPPALARNHTENILLSTAAGHAKAHAKSNKAVSQVTCRSAPQRPLASLSRLGYRRRCIKSKKKSGCTKQHS